jgi:hypothetical protein
MEWVKQKDDYNVPIKSWCKDIEDGAMAQASDLAKNFRYCRNATRKLKALTFFPLGNSC